MEGRVDRSLSLYPRTYLFDGGVVELPGDDVDDAVGDAEGLVELLGGQNHLGLHLAGHLQVALAHHELLHLSVGAWRQRWWCRLV